MKSDENKLEKFNKVYEQLTKMTCEGIVCEECPFNKGVIACHLII